MNLNACLTFLMVVSMSALSVTLAAADESGIDRVPVGAGDAPYLDLASVDFSPILQQGQQDWQREYDAARARKSGGKKKMFTGLALRWGGHSRRLPCC